MAAASSSSPPLRDLCPYRGPSPDSSTSTSVANKFGETKEIELRNLGASHAAFAAEKPSTIGIETLGPRSGHSYPNLPAITSAVTKVQDWIEQAKILWDSIQLHDIESTTDSAIQLLNAPFQIAYSICTFSQYVTMFIPHILKILQLEFLTALTPFSSVFGFVICCFEGLFEFFSFQRIVDFRQDYHWTIAKELLLIEKEKSSEKRVKKFNHLYHSVFALSHDVEDFDVELNLFRRILDNHLIEQDNFFNANDWQSLQKSILSQTLSWLENSFFNLSPKERAECEQAFLAQTPEEQDKNPHSYFLAKSLISHQAALARRIGTWPLAKEKHKLSLHSTIQKTLNLFIAPKKQSPEDLKATISFAQEHIISVIDEQSKKKLYIHITGIAALTITLIGLILSASVLGLSMFVPLAFVVVGMGLGIIRYILSTALLESPHWKFNWRNSIPDCIYNLRQTASEKWHQLSHRINSFSLQLFAHG